MDISSLSVSLAQKNINTDVGVAMLSKSLDSAENTGTQLVKMIDATSVARTVQPHLGASIDVYV